MHRIVFFAIWCTVLLIPWEEMAFVADIGTLARVCGGVTFALALLAVFRERRVLQLPIPLLIYALFVAWSGMSGFWSIEPEATLEQTVTYSLLLCFGWVLWQYSQSPQEREWLMIAWVLGCFATLVSQFFSTSAPQDTQQRYAALGKNENSMALCLAISMAFAWCLGACQSNRGSLRFLAWLYTGFAGVGVVLTGSRAGFIGAALWAGSTLSSSRHLGWKSIALFALMVMSLVQVTALVVPDHLIERVTEGRASRSYQERIDLWIQGLTALTMRPIGGFGAGTDRHFRALLGGGQVASHSTMVSILVENGLVGAVLYGSFVASVLMRLRALSLTERGLWRGVLLSCLPIFLSGSEQYAKPLWFVLMLALSSTRNMASQER